MIRDRLKPEDSVIFFIQYIPIFTISLASKKNRPKLLAIHPPPLPFGAVFSFISIKGHVRKYRERCGRAICFPYTPVFTDGLVLGVRE